MTYDDVFCHLDTNPEYDGQRQTDRQRLAMKSQSGISSVTRWESEQWNDLRRTREIRRRLIVMKSTECIRNNHCPNYIYIWIVRHLQPNWIGLVVWWLWSKKNYATPKWFTLKNASLLLNMAKYLIINVYLPCVGTKDRLCEQLLGNLWYRGGNGL